MSNVIDAVFKLTDEFSKPFNNCISALNDAGKVGKQTRKQVDKVGQSISKVGLGLTAAVTTPLVMFGKSSYETFSEVDQQLALVQETMGQSDEEFKVLTDEVKRAASVSILDMSDAAEASLNFARAGYKAADAAYLLQPAMDLAVGTGTDLSTVTEGLGSVMKAFGADTEEAAQYASILTAAQAQANTDTTGVFEAMKAAGSTVKEVGWDIKDLAAISDVFGDAMVDGSEGGTALKTSLMRLASPAKSGAAAMEELGLATGGAFEIFDENGEMKSMTETFQNLAKAFEGLSTQDALAAASDIFGKNQGDNMMKLINNVDSLTEYRNALDDVTNDLASTTAASQMEAEGSAIDSLSSALDVLKFTIGELESKYVTPIIIKIANLANAFNEMGSEEQEQILKFAAIAAAVGPCLIVFGKLVSGVAGVAGVISKLSTAGGIVKGALAAISAPAGVVIAIIAAAIALIAIIISRIDDFKASIAQCVETNAPRFEALGAAFSNLGGTVMPVIQGIATLIGDVLVGAFDAVVNSPFFTIFLASLTAIINGVSEVLGGLITFLVDIFTGQWGDAWNGILEILRGVCDLIGGVIGGITSAIGGVAEAISGAASGVVGFFTGGGAGEANAAGDPHFKGGITSVNEQGGEIMNLPNGTQIIPHDLSRNLIGNSGSTVTITGNTFTVREQADIDRITDALVRKMYRAQANMGTA